MTDTEIIEGDAAEVGTDLEPARPPGTLFHTDDPVVVLERAARVADALKGVIVTQGLFKQINGKPHVFVEAWATCGAMLGLTSYVVWSRPIGEATPAGHDWEARVEVRALDGRTVGAAEAMCTRAESKWRARDDYAVRSMAQTRATSKAFRGPLGFIVTLAGYSATPAEEMPADAESVSDVTPPRAAQEAPKPIGDAAAAEIILNSDVAGIPRDDLRKAVWYAAGQPSDRLGKGTFGLDGEPVSQQHEQYAVDVLAAFLPEQRDRVMKWMVKRVDLMAEEAKGATA
jgi:hypothetical protein